MPLLPDRHNDVTSRPELPEPCPELIWAAACRPSEAVTWRKIFPGTAEHVGDARRLTGVFLDDTPYADDAAWIVGELAANAVLHTRSGEPGGQYVLELRRTRRIARLTVCDLGGGDRPSFAPTVPGLPYAEHGYGLRTIAQLAARTGFRGNPAFGHAVWADLLLGG